MNINRTLYDAGMTYCYIKFLSGGISLILIAISLIMAAVYLYNNMDTSSYIETESIITSFKSGLQSSNNQSNYFTELNYKYIVDSKEYNIVLPDSSKFLTQNDADNYGTNKINSKKIIFYNPKQPENAVEFKDIEDKLSFGMSGIAVLLIISGVLSIVLRTNEIFCGLQIASDVTSTLFRK